MAGQITEAEALKLPRKVVTNEGDLLDLEISPTIPILQRVLGGLKGQIAYVKLSHPYAPFAFQRLCCHGAAKSPATPPRPFFRL
jgi:hypothetical protein